MNLIYKPISITDVAPLFGLQAEALGQLGAMRLPAPQGAPCRLTLEDAAEGEPILLLNYSHQRSGPYRSDGPIFVRENAREVEPQLRAPESFRQRLYSARSYAVDGWMIDADVIQGSTIECGLEKLFQDERASYIHLHHARRGCFACRVERR